MKLLLALLLVGVAFFANYERQRILAMQAELDTTHQQLDDTQKRFDEVQKQLTVLKDQMAKEGVAVSAPAQPGATPVVKKTGQWMWDPNHKSALDRGGRP